MNLPAFVKYLAKLDIFVNYIAQSFEKR